MSGELGMGSRVLSVARENGVAGGPSLGIGTVESRLLRLGAK